MRSAGCFAFLLVCEQKVLTRKFECVDNNHNFLNNLQIYAYHESGHAVVAETLGMPFKHVQLSRIKRKDASLWEVVASGYKQQARRMQDDDWQGNTPIAGLSSGIEPLWSTLDLVPDDLNKDVRVRCTIKLAGLVVEKLMRIDEWIIRDGSSMDASGVNGLIEQCFPPEERQNEWLDAEKRARTILSEIACWTRVQNIAQGIISAINEGREPDQSNEYLDHYVFNRAEIKRYVILDANPV
jgi:hypothetical protein